LHRLLAFLPRMCLQCLSLGLTQARRSVLSPSIRAIRAPCQVM
jgi:hypothetical protein